MLNQPEGDGLSWWFEQRSFLFVQPYFDGSMHYKIRNTQRKKYRKEECEKKVQNE